MNQESFGVKTFYILGVGCKRCRRLAENAETAAKELGIEYELIRITDIEEIVEFGVMTTPALVVDEEIKIVGKVASIEEIKSLLG